MSTIFIWKFQILLQELSKYSSFWFILCTHRFIEAAYHCKHFVCGVDTPSSSGRIEVLRGKPASWRQARRHRRPGLRTRLLAVCGAPPALPYIVKDTMLSLPASCLVLARTLAYAGTASARKSYKRQISAALTYLHGNSK